MGEVFLAEDTRLKRRVALKSLTEDWAVKPDAQRQLLHEARAAAALNHPNIAAIYDVLQGEDGAYIVMEYVPGETLAERLATGPLPPEAVVWIGTQLCDALAEAHAHDIIHRDLKPKNLALTPDGRLKVLDFGLAKTLVIDPSNQETPSSAPLDLSRAGQRVVGTPPYLPPETLLGEAALARCLLLLDAPPAASPGLLRAVPSPPPPLHHPYTLGCVLVPSCGGAPSSRNLSADRVPDPRPPGRAVLVSPLHDRAQRMGPPRRRGLSPRLRGSGLDAVAPTTTHHDLHHRDFRGNYGLYFAWWDQMLGTEHPEYQSVFDEVTRHGSCADAYPQRSA